MSATPHIAMTRLDNAGDAYYITRTAFPNVPLDVVSHGPDWLQVREPDGVPFWLQWNALGPFHLIEG
jgi:hypothetical protein